MDLFEHATQMDRTQRPFADAVRPCHLDDFCGQDDVVGPNTFFDGPRIGPFSEHDFVGTTWGR